MSKLIQRSRLFSTEDFITGSLRTWARSLWLISCVSTAPEGPSFAKCAKCQKVQMRAIIFDQFDHIKIIASMLSFKLPGDMNSIQNGAVMCLTRFSWRASCGHVRRKFVLKVESSVRTEMKELSQPIVQYWIICWKRMALTTWSPNKMQISWRSPSNKKRCRSSTLSSLGQSPGLQTSTRRAYAQKPPHWGALKLHPPEHELVLGSSKHKTMQDWVR